nr:helix-turn-helix transcriptional regulator [Rhodococcus sp. Chr-9]
MPSRQRWRAGLDQNSGSLQIIFREGTPSRDPQVLIIAQNLADPNLCASQIAAEHNVSVRTLHRLFSATGQGVAEHIRTLRLERIKTELADPTSRRYTISALARKWGFLDPSTFSRAFKDAYGITAREWAASASAPPTEAS